MTVQVLEAAQIGEIGAGINGAECLLLWMLWAQAARARAVFTDHIIIWMP